ncbi:hypothetical protein FOMA001_g5467 [Fusarium oxysporum f. sp. matthiolae]|nr:hypothetical protein FOMA001_g5467 [Fusarium oxysporum f. sp. matthiolae]
MGNIARHTPFKEETLPQIRVQFIKGFNSTRPSKRCDYQVKARTRQAKGEAETKSGDYDNDANMEQKKKKAHGVPRLIWSAMEVAQAACRSYTRYNVF